MGADTFTTRAKGKTPKEAFAAALDQAQYDHGHSGYSGTIAEKHAFTVIPLPQGKEPGAYAYELIDARDRRIDDKWGPAGCIDLGKGEYLFFGWASS